MTSAQNSWRTNGAGFHVTGRPANSYPSPELQAILDRLIYVSPLRGFNIRAYTVEDTELNAFSDGNAVYFHRPLLNLLNNDTNKIASVMAHELGHVIANHVKNRVTRMTMQAISEALAALSKDQDTNQLVNEVFTISSFAFERNEEKEADIIGATLAHKAGFDSGGLITALELMAQRQNQDVLKYAALLAPHVMGYNNAVSNYKFNVSLFNMNRSNQARANAIYWANIANQHIVLIQSDLSAIQQYVGMTNPLYLSHPTNAQRSYTVNLVRTKEVNNLSPLWLSQQDESIGRIYQTINARIPKA